MSPDFFGLDVDENGLVDVEIVRIEENEVVLEVQAKIECEVNASFGLQAWDSIDREYIGMGSTSCSKEESYRTAILIYLTGDFENGFDDVDVAEIEVLETISDVDFGYIEPDFGQYGDE